MATVINQETYFKWKQQLQGPYQRFNNEITKKYVNKIFNYGYLLESAKYYDTFEEFYAFHTLKREKLLKENLELMYQENIEKGFNYDKATVYAMFIVRIGNAYTGMAAENVYIKGLNFIDHNIECIKQQGYVDKELKVDALLKFKGYGSIALQIKPVSNLFYTKGEELEFHEEYTKSTGTKVFYLYYEPDLNTFTLDKQVLKLSEPEKIVEKLKQLMVYK